MFASAVEWPVVVIAIAVVVALCLWGLFRRGSMSDRARSDDGQSTDPPTAGH